jgi:peptide/nickel transport system substrate-binding protein
MIRGVDPELFDQLKNESGRGGVQMGAGFDSEMLWFNQVPGAPIGADRKSWFRSREFRKAISHAINRADIVRLVFRGYAEPAFGPYNAANRLFYNPEVKPDPWSLDSARRLLKQAGFTWRSDTLFDPVGIPVEFSIVTNAGSKVRTRMATMIQQDLKALGIKVAVVPLDFPSLIERITKTYAYEACLLGLVNVDADPSGQMNVWMSSGANHQWNPRQATPQTSWEAEIDRLMLAQASTVDMRLRKASFDRVQQVISEQVPFIYLVSTSALAAAKPTIRNLAPSPMRPHLVWNVEHLRVDEATKR